MTRLLQADRHLFMVAAVRWSMLGKYVRAIAADEWRCLGEAPLEKSDRSWRNAASI
jgi:hypothetical protein